MIEGKKFADALQEVFDSIEKFMELTKESEYPMLSEDGVHTYIAEVGKYPFQIAGQFHRPNEYLRCLLDMLQANFEPEILGTFFLNSNMSFLYDNLPKGAFALGYLSLIKPEDESWEYFVTETLSNKSKMCGYDKDNIRCTFIVLSAGDEYSFELVEKANHFFDSGMSINETIGLIRGAVIDKQNHVAFCHDRSLGKKVRFSAWFIFAA
ncbi:hypothetical protein [Alteromonas lipolytica]|uniref:Uncharacterized protein n=1 Tax=Alteromonas lipolytica TaxID=1856405 RepID=A0A1E8FE46_9ALTE|nr:hypothetical protein [Alteromonas lipolytica]OFI34189.1 hypothetical protein BFC17_21875 [Alteromonas lipolytica]GGF84275.1 hypothetical protein GCM10011338_40730 [Alteromonas lipolytica]